MGVHHVRFAIFVQANGFFQQHYIVGPQSHSILGQTVLSTNSHPQFSKTHDASINTIHQHKHSRPASTVNIHLNKQRNVHNKTPNNGSLPFLFHPAIQITPASSLSRKKKCFDNAVVVRF